MFEQPSSIELYRSKKEHITIDPVYCFGILDNKHFLVMRETKNENEVYIRWQKNQNTRFSKTNVVGLRAEKLLKLILSKLPKNQMTEKVISEMEVMIRKNKKASESMNENSIQEKTEQATPYRSEEDIKKERDFKKYMDNKAIYAAQNEKRKQEKELRRQEKAAKKEEERRLRQEAAKIRIQAEKTLKELKEQEKAYTKMVLSENIQTPIIMTINNTNIILGYLNDKFYRIKMNDNEGSFYTVSNNKLEPMDAQSLHKIIVMIDENCNQNSQFDHLLTYIVTAFDKFSQNAKPIEKNTLRERVAIGKNILIQKGLLTPQNTL